MKIYYQDEATTLYHGDCLDVLESMPDNSIDAIITDPPYGLSNTKPRQVADVLKAWVAGDTEAVPAKRGGFMGKEWDSFVPPPAVWEECLRVLKPGGHMAVFAGARTQDLMGLSIRLAGFEIRDSLAWLYGSGFPKSHDVGKAIDREAGAEREVIGSKTTRIPGGTTYAQDRWTQEHRAISEVPVTAPATPEAQQWDGWGTALKPAFEPIVLARKPLAEKTVAKNVLEHGTGAINVDACRIGATDNAKFPAGVVSETESVYGGGAGIHGDRPRTEDRYPSSRWPANVLLDEHAATWVDEQSGNVNGVIGKKKVSGGHNFNIGEHTPQTFTKSSEHIKDSGGASRFFYTAKAPKRERPVIEREDGTKIQHPTVKPLALMQWLIRLITPPGGTVLDPFAGSGTTIEAAMMEGFNSIGIEMEPDYLRLIATRIKRAKTTAQEATGLGGVS